MSLGQTDFDIADRLTALLPGQAIGRYEIVSVAGCGAMGPTYQVRDLEFGFGLIAREFLPGGLAVRSDDGNVVPRSGDLVVDFARARARFVEEGRALCALKRAPFVVRAIEVIDDHLTSYTIFEKVMGNTLQHRLAAGIPLGPLDVERLLPPLLDGLCHLHAAGLIHGDIRPANIALTPSGAPKLIEFGRTRAWMPARFLSTGVSSTLAYDPPEKIAGGEYDARGDLYALAATLHHAITGHRPLSADRLKGDRQRPLVEHAPRGFDRVLLSAVDRAMALEPGNRFESATSWRNAVWPSRAARLSSAPGWKGAMGTSGRSVAANMREAGSARVPQRRRGMVGGVMASAAMLAGIAAAVLYLDRDASRPLPTVAANTSAGEAATSDSSAQAVRAAMARQIERKRAAMQAMVQSVEDEIKQSDRARQEAEVRRAAAGKAEAERLAAALKAKQQAAAQAEAKRLVAAREAEQRAAADTVASPAEAAPAPVAPSANSPALVSLPTAEAPESVAPPPTVPAAALAGAAPGLLIRARSGETLHALYSRVYRGLAAPPFVEVAAINREPVRAGDILMFPAPAGGWTEHEARAATGAR